MIVALSSFQIYPAVNAGYNPDALEVRWWYNRGFIDSTTVFVQGGNGQQGFYITSTCTVNGSGIITVPSTNLFSTLDAIDPNPQSIQIFGRLYSGNAPKQYVTAFSSTPTGWVIQNETPLTYEDLVLQNQAIVLANPPDVFPTFAQMIAYIDSLVPTPLASDVVIGRTELSAPPVNALIPIAAGNNDHRLVSTVYNVDQYPFYAPTDGTTDASAEIQAALDAAAITGGVVVLPSEVYNLGATGVTVASNVTLAAPAYRDQPNLLYSGTGVAVDTSGSFYVGLQNLFVKMTNAAATGFRWGDSVSTQSQWCWAENLTAWSNLGTPANNVGIGFDFRATAGMSVPQFSGNFYGRSLISIGNKYGINVESAGGNESWTGISLDRIELVVSGTGSTISGSVGIRVVNSNLEGSVINGLFIEGYAEPFDWSNVAGNFGFTILNMGNENNTNTTGTFPFSWAGSVYDPHNGGYYQSASSNGLSNRWDGEKKINGEWLTESDNRRIHDIYDGNSDNLQWGVVRGGSIINSELTRDKFIVSTSTAANTSYVRNWFKLLEFKTAYHTAAPTDGSWGIGSQIPNAAPAVGLPSGWVCLTSGTFKTALAGVTGTIAINTRSLVVNSVSTMAVGDYISIVGVTGTKLIVAISAVGPTITIDSDSSASVAGAAVQYVTPTFQANDNLGTSRGARVVSQFDVTSNTTPANVTGLSVMLESGFTYTFVARLYTTSNVAGGVKCAIGGTATAASFTCSALVFDANAISGPTRTTTKGNTVGNVTAVTAAYIEIVGTIATSASGAGTLTVQFSQNASSLTASSVLVNSTLETQLIG